MSSGTAVEARMQVLFICTANICRTPLAVGLFNARARGVVPAAAASAGLLTEGEPAASNSVTVLAERGIDGADHRSRMLRREHLHDADLVLGLARRHVREAILLEPPAFGRTFTLKELVRRGERAGRRQPGEALEGWLERVGAGRRPGDLLGEDAADDVADPIGRPIAAYRATADEIDGLLARLFEVLWPGSGDVHMEDAG